MTEEMLQDEVIESNDDQQVEDSQEVAESQEVAPKNDDFVELNPEQQKKFNKLTWEKNEAIRKAKALEEQLKTKPQQPVEQVSATTDVKPPNPELMYSEPEQYQQEMMKYQQSLIDAAKAEAAKAARSFVEEEKTASQQAAQKAAQQEILSSYEQRAIESGLNAQKLIEAENVVAAYNPSQEVRDFILSDPNGPHLVNYLADHQAELEQLVSMPSMRAALHIEKLREKALNANKGTKAPDPVEPLGGRGAVDESPWLSGATFE